jgi:hypothetical protein
MIQSLQCAPSPTFKALRGCWRPPFVEEVYHGIQVTVRLSFNARGEIQGQPRFTYVTPGVPDEVRAAYESAIADLLRKCTPLAFSSEFGATFAGKPYYLHFVEKRQRDGSESRPDRQ